MVCTRQGQGAGGDCAAARTAWGMRGAWAWYRHSRRGPAYETVQRGLAMSRVMRPAAVVDYPYSDGRPLAESEAQLRAILYLVSALNGHFR